MPVEAGQGTLKEAVNEALRAWAGRCDRAHYILGSALGPHPFPTLVRTFQTVIGEEARAQVLELYRAHVRGLAACQSSAGLWHQLLDRPGTYLETSASAIFVYAIAHGINRGDWAGKADGGDTVRRNGNGDDDVFIERDVLDGFGWFSQRDGGGQQEDTNL